MSSSPETSSDRFSDADDVLSGVLENESDSPTETRSRGQLILDRLIVSRDLAILIVAILLFAFFTLGNPMFASVFNLLDIARRMPYIGIVAVGMTYLFIAREIDLSVGSNYGFCASVLAYL